MAGAAFQKIQKLSTEKSAVGAHQDLPHPLGEAMEAFRQKLDGPIGGIGRTRSEPAMETFSALRNKTQEGMVALLPFFLGVVSLGRSFPGSIDPSHRGIQIEGDPAEPFFGPDLFPGQGLHLG